jgi:acetoin utilization deacetylase AcuC-like enzyme
VEERICKVPVVYSPRYRVDIGAHVFPTNKFRLVHARLLESGILRPSDVVEPEPASWGDLGLVHTAAYLARVRDGTLTPEDLAGLQLPWSEDIVEGFRTMVGGTIQAARLACRLDQSEIDHPRLSIHVGGGLHHAFASHGEGFCLFNDVAVAVRVLQTRGIERVAIVDLDVHHGNGTAFIFESDPRVFTFSMHQQHNYPEWKPRGSLDIGLPDGTRDGTFLSRLQQALPAVMASQPQCVFYLAGADPYQDDQLGGLGLTREGLRARDRMVIEAVRRAEVPLVITLAGGYARRVEDTVSIHVATIEEAIR